MKKISLTLALAGCSLVAMAQSGEDAELKYSVATNSFFSNWFVSADLSYDAFYSYEEEKKDFSMSPFKGFRSGIGLSLAVGKWFTPGIGLRTKFTFPNGRHVTTESASDNKMKFWNLQEQVLFNVTNLFCGYSNTRKYNLIPYAGMGVLRNCSNSDYAYGGSIGLLNTYALTDKLSINLDLGVNISADDYADAAASHKDYGISLATMDRYFNFEVGVTYHLGQPGWKRSPDVDALKELAQSQIDAISAQYADEEAENARLKKQLEEANKRAEETKTVTVHEVLAAPVSVFFSLNSFNVNSPNDVMNVKALAEVAKAKNAKLVVTGYADNKKDQENGNQILCERRAEYVKAELVKMGISEEDIEVVVGGASNNLTPYTYNRRATISIKQ